MQWENKRYSIQGQPSNVSTHADIDYDNIIMIFRPYTQQIENTQSPRYDSNISIGSGIRLHDLNEFIIVIVCD